MLKMFRCNRIVENPFTSAQKLFTQNIRSTRKRYVLRLNHQLQRLSSSNTLSSKTVSGNLGSGLCIIGGTVFLGIGFYKYMSHNQVKCSASEAAAAKGDEDSVVVSVPEFPPEVQYLLIGGGTASYSAMRAIRKHDVTAKVLIISDEDQAPYMRPPLSKELWFSEDREAAKKFEFKQWNGKTRDIFFEKSEFFCKPSELDSKTGGGVALALQKRVVALNPSDNVATLNDGTKIKYNKCLIATGGEPRNLPSSVLKPDSGVMEKTTLYRKTTDFLKLDEATNDVKSVTVIGGGFMGSEIACALGHKGKKMGFEVNQIFPEQGNMGLVLPEYLTKWTTEKVRKEGVNVITETMVRDVCMEDGKVKVTTKNDEQILTDHLVVAVGLNIDTSLADSAEIEVDEKFGGYRVNSELQARSNIWVAGDASCFYDAKLGRRRVEHHDHAVVSGRLAGENMTGAQKSYFHQSMFWSDLGPEVGYEAIGLVDSRLPTVGVFAKATEKDSPRGRAEGDSEGTVESGATPQSNESGKDEFGKGVVFYLRDNKPVGLLLWNVFGRMAVARKLLQDQQPHEDYGEVAKLFKIHSEELD